MDLYDYLSNGQYYGYRLTRGFHDSPECYDDEPKQFGDNVNRRTVPYNYSIIDEEENICGMT